MGAGGWQPWTLIPAVTSSHSPWASHFPSLGLNFSAPKRRGVARTMLTVPSLPQESRKLMPAQLLLHPQPLAERGWPSVFSSPEFSMLSYLVQGRHTSACERPCRAQRPSQPSLTGGTHLQHLLPRQPRKGDQQFFGK